MKTSMLPFLLGVVVALCGGTAFGGDEGPPAAKEARAFDRSILKEPAYRSAPKYSLLTFGKNGEVRVWMVEDGRRLFVDKNANGDLTDDGPPVEPSHFRNLDEKRWDFEYVLDAITAADGTRHTDFVLRCWSYDTNDLGYGLSLTVDGQVPMYVGWFGTFWSADREKAPVIQFGGAFTPVLLRGSEFTIGEEQPRLSFCFMRRGSRFGADAMLNIDAVPRWVTPVVHIEWPTVEGGAAVRTSHRLSERCCNWEFYTTSFKMPKGVALGTAKLTIELPADTMPVELTTREIKVRVAAPMQ
jgi:hypothetical protein